MSLRLVSEISFIVDTSPLGGGRLTGLPRATFFSALLNTHLFILLLEMRLLLPRWGIGLYLPIQFDELAYTVLASSAEPEHVVSNHGTPWNETDVKYHELTRQRETCTRQHSQTMCTFNPSKSKQNKTLFRIQ